ncbi:hypothetical protein DLAC_08566 [Tieghemostelium lacteum]|uniref:THH1/TOM1/TOM3 domain-containing protein n=1 Tax=Tieghemostelium lacteum TaxID=361077 RepID=A0A151Z7T6_TIELA|nr:hypothetical protein DLAC_08566 [Tieghemostelium lacteum]|eukprot:KYQ89995.1 hypothetical protein DLAC_08566 [Tieghemostelium lacteum]
MSDLDSYGWSHAALIGVYLTMLLASVWVLIKSSGQIMERTIFHVFFFLGCSAKIISFVLYILIIDDIKHIDINGNLVYLLTTAPSFLYLTVYSVVLLKCIDVYQILSFHSLYRDITKKKILIIFAICTTLFYLSLSILFILDFKLYPEPKASVNSPVSKIQIVIQILDASIYILASIGFFFYMYYFYTKYYSEIEGKFKYEYQTKFYKRVIAVILSTFVAFILRSPFVILSIFFPLDVWWKDVVYYGLFECLPLSLLLYVWQLIIKFLKQQSRNSVEGLENPTTADTLDKNDNFKTPLIKKPNAKTKLLS